MIAFINFITYTLALICAALGLYLAASGDILSGCITVITVGVLCVLNAFLTA